MLELIIICAVIVFLVSWAEKVRTQKAQTAVKQAAAGALAAGGNPGSAPSTPTAKPPRSLTIEGTSAFPVNQAAFFRGFGIPTAQLCDARYFRFPGGIAEFPEAVAIAVQMLYDEGTAMGTAVMSLVHQGRKLAADEAVYFALTKSAKSEEYSMYAFVDRVREPTAT
jgi:hypothetical protein